MSQWSLFFMLRENMGEVGNFLFNYIVIDSLFYWKCYTKFKIIGICFNLGNKFG